MGKGSGCATSKAVPVKYEVRNAVESGEDSSRRVNNSSSSAPVQAVSRAYGGSLPEGWRTAVDPSTGRTYFVDEVNKRSQWEDPRSGLHQFSAGGASSSSQSAPPLRPLPPNWDERVDPTSGRPYFVNLLTKYVTWDDPRLMPAAQDQDIPVAYPPPNFYPGYSQAPNYAPQQLPPQHPAAPPPQVSYGGYGYPPQGPAGYPQQPPPYPQGPQYAPPQAPPGYYPPGRDGAGPFGHSQGPPAYGSVGPAAAAAAAGVAVGAVVGAALAGRRKRKPWWRWGAGGHAYASGGYGHGYHSGGVYYGGYHHYSSNSSSSDSDTDLTAVGIGAGLGLGLGMGAADVVGGSAEYFSDNEGVDVVGAVIGDDAMDAIGMYGGAGPRDLPGDGGGGGGGGGLGAAVASGGRRQPSRWGRRRWGKGKPWQRLIKKMTWTLKRRRLWHDARRWLCLCLRHVWWAVAVAAMAVLAHVVGVVAWVAPGLGQTSARMLSHWLQRWGCPWALRQHLHRLGSSGSSRNRSRRRPWLKHHQHQQHYHWLSQKTRKRSGLVHDVAEALLGPWLALVYATAELLSSAVRATVWLLWRLVALYYEYVHVHRPARLRLLGRRWRWDSALPAQCEREVTIVTQASMDRLPAIEAMARAWDGPMSIALFLHHHRHHHHDTAAMAAEEEGEEQRCWWAQVAALHARVEALQRCRLSIVVAVDADTHAHVTPTEAQEAHAAAQAKEGPVARSAGRGALARYPVNALRNVALASARTEMVLLLDADFVPSRGLHEALTADADTFNALKTKAVDSQQLLVLPAFEIITANSSSRSSSNTRHTTNNNTQQDGRSSYREQHSGDNSTRQDGESDTSRTHYGRGREEEEGGGGQQELLSPIPGSMAELAAAWAVGVATPFHCGHFPQGHAPTNYKRFFLAQSSQSSQSSQGQGQGDRTCTTAAPEGLDTYPVEYREYYEPYFIAAKSQLPRYNESFRGYGLNKIAHVYECAARAMPFRVLRGHFVAALEHPHSPAWDLTYGHAKDPLQQLRIRGLYCQFKAGLRRKGYSLQGAMLSQTQLGKTRMAEVLV